MIRVPAALIPAEGKLSPQQWLKENKKLETIWYKILN